MTQREAKRMACRLVAQKIDSLLAIWDQEDDMTVADWAKVAAAMQELGDELMARGERGQP